MIFEGRRGPFSESKSIKIRFRIEFTKLLHLTSVFLGATDGHGAGLKGGSSGFKMGWNIDRIRGLLPKSASGVPRPPSRHVLAVDFGRFGDGL